MTNWHALSSPLVIGHRGASAEAPENTIAAFELALAQGADGVELDVQLAADGALVVIHLMMSAGSISRPLSNSVSHRMPDA